MKRQNKKLRIFSVTLYLCSMVCLVLGFTLTIIVGSSTRIFKVESLSRTVSDKEFTDSYKKLSDKSLRPILYYNFNDAVENSKYFPTSFIGKLTHYGPDCALCGGHLGCNGQDARNGNIYYNDKEYGTVRIVATSKAIPCGSIIRINVDVYDKNGMYAIVLDRGVGASHVDLLKTSETAISPVRTTNNVRFDIVRYGY